MSETRVAAVGVERLPALEEYAPRSSRRTAVLIVLAVLLSLVPVGIFASRAVGAPADGRPVVSSQRPSAHRAGALAATRRAAAHGEQLCEEAGWGSDVCSAVISTAAFAAPSDVSVVGDADAARIFVTDLQR